MRTRLLSLLGILVAVLPLSGCFGISLFGYTATNPRECLIRAMYFESNRSSEEGMLAVGTVVMNRLAAPGFPKTLCGVVGQKNQFADGVLNRPMTERASLARASSVADSILAGARHPACTGAMFFHTSGLRFPYNNMHYVLVAGGNAFYEKY
jgi:spore germination cell wall hydrolase CwlJ-like protein